MTRFIVLLAVLFLVLVASDPEKYVEFGWTMGLFIIAMALLIGKLDKAAAKAIAVIGILLFGITLVGVEYSQEIQIAVGLAAVSFIVWVLIRWRNRRARRPHQRTPEERQRFQERSTGA